MKTEVQYPPAPWHLTRELWCGYFKVDQPVALRSGLRPFPSTRWRIVMLVRYLGGTRTYDELVIGAVAFRGFRLGLFVEYFWVEDEVGMWAGRRIWGLPKELASFTWDENKVSIADAEGPIMALTVNRAEPAPLPMWMPAPSFGRLEGRWAYAIPRLSARLGKAGMEISESSARFPYRAQESPRLAFSLKNFLMTLPSPTILPVEADSMPQAQQASDSI